VPAGVPAPILYDIVNDDQDGNYTIAWSEVEGAYYQVMENLDYTGFTEIYKGTNLSVERTEMPPGTHCYNVRARKNDQWSPWAGEKCTIVVEQSMTNRVSVDSDGAQGDNISSRMSISGDGSLVAFQSSASNLVAGDTNGEKDIFVHDRQSGKTSRVSVDSTGIQGNGPSYEPSISVDGRFVAFRSWANNLATGDTNGSYDIFVHDRQSEQTSRVSVDSAGTQGDMDSYGASISADGLFVAFHSVASNLVADDTNGASDIFVHNRENVSSDNSISGVGRDSR